MQNIEINQGTNLMNNVMKCAFNVSIIFLVMMMIISVFIWLIGVKLKSEKAIKTGIRISISMLIIIILLIGIILIIANLK
ncbi:MAG: hypothetical protein HFJ45_01035 [Clostridia bacterium]|nr:hypothetical protein [Clostridia bacterium]